MKKSRTSAAPHHRQAHAPLGRRAERTREKILDTAEALFARLGLFGVTLKQIAIDAKVDTALVHYYFVDKQGVFDEVVHRRSEKLNSDRRRALDDYVRNAGNSLTVEGVLEAFLGPMLDQARAGGSGWKNYFALLGQAHSAPGWGAKIVTRHFDPSVTHLVEVLRRTKPQWDEEGLYWGIVVLAGAVALALSNTGRIDRLSGGRYRSSDFEAAKRHLVPFLAAGFERVCAPQPRRAKATPRIKRS